MKKFSHFIVSAALILSFSVISSLSFANTPANAACGDPLFTFPAWYDGLKVTNSDECIVSIGGGSSNTKLIRDIVTIVLNIVEVVLQLIAYATVVFLIIGGFRYMTSAGSPEGVKAAKATITNAVIGLVISLSAVGIVNIVAGIIQ